MKQLFINVIGHNSSGKTTLAKRLETDLKLNRVSGDEFREFIHDHIRYFQDTDISYPNQRYTELTPLILQYRQELIRVLLRAKQHMLFDGSGSTKSLRTKYLDKVHSDFPDVITVIIWVDIPEDELLIRLKRRGGKWLSQYRELKKESFQPPEANESKTVLRYDQHNYNVILSQLRELLA